MLGNCELYWLLFVTSGITCDWPHHQTKSTQGESTKQRYQIIAGKVVWGSWKNFPIHTFTGYIRFNASFFCLDGNRSRSFQHFSSFYLLYWKPWCTSCTSHAANMDCKQALPSVMEKQSAAVWCCIYKRKQIWSRIRRRPFLLGG